MAQRQVSIENWWNEHGNYMEQLTAVQTPEEVLIWAWAFHLYADYLFDKGELSRALTYVDRALEITARYSTFIPQNQHTYFLELFLKQKGAILLDLRKEWKHFRTVRQLQKLFPQHEGYRKESCWAFQALVNSIVMPCYIVIVLIWIAMFVEHYVTHTELIPNEAFAVGWVIWLALLFTQFIVPRFYPLFYRKK